jgi:hypothetical protein
MMYLMHLNDFYEFDSIEPNSKKHRNIEKIRFGSIEIIRFGSIFQESSRVLLYSYLICSISHRYSDDYNLISLIDYIYILNIIYWLIGLKQNSKKHIKL